MHRFEGLIGAAYGENSGQGLSIIVILRAVHYSTISMHEVRAVPNLHRRFPRTSLIRDHCGSLRRTKDGTKTYSTVIIAHMSIRTPQTFH
jgi:hypothetical protein